MNQYIIKPTSVEECHKENLNISIAHDTDPIIRHRKQTNNQIEKNPVRHTQDEKRVHIRMITDLKTSDNVNIDRMDD